MKKMVLMAGLVVAVALFAGGLAFAWCGSGMGYGPGYRGSYMGYGPGSHGRGVNTATVRNVQKETLSLRDELMAKEIDLENEYMKPAPDAARVASIKKDIIDIQTKIQVVADKYGAPAWGPGYGSMMADAGYPCPIWR